MVLLEDYLGSKWPMIELAEFVHASKSGNMNLNYFLSSTKPLFLILIISQSSIGGGAKDRACWSRFTSGS